MILLRPPGVYAPQADSLLLAGALSEASVSAGARALDVCTGTGLLALTAARLGATEVTAVDVSPAAVLATRSNALLRRLPVRVELRDIRQWRGGQRFDVVTANPPYVPCPTGHGTSRRSRAALAWDAGEDGRLHLDRLCTLAPQLLLPGGCLLVVHSAVCGTDLTLRRLEQTGLKAAVVARRLQRFGPVLTERAAWLEQRGLIRTGQRVEELVVVRADRPIRPA